MSGETVTTVKGVLRVCCADPTNLIAEPQASDLLVRTCRVCGRHHYEFGVDPGRLGVKGEGL
jgi:hypothetical protein